MNGHLPSPAGTRGELAWPSFPRVLGYANPLVYHTHPHPAKAGSCVHGRLPSPAGTRGGTGLAFLPKGAQVYQPSVPSPEKGFPKRGTYDSMGATGQVSPCGQTPDGGYSVREPAVRAWGDRLRRSTGARRKKGPEEARLGLDRTTRIIRVAGSRLK